MVGQPLLLVMSMATWKYVVSKVDGCVGIVRDTREIGTSVRHFSSRSTNSRVQKNILIHSI